MTPPSWIGSCTDCSLCLPALVGRVRPEGWCTGSVTHHLECAKRSSLEIEGIDRNRARARRRCAQAVQKRDHAGPLLRICASYGTRGKAADHAFANPCLVLTGRNIGRTRVIHSGTSDRCQRSRKDRPQSGRCTVGPSRCSTKPALSVNVRSTVGCRIVPIRMPATAPSTLPVDIHRPESLRRPLLSRSPKMLDSIGDTCPECQPADCG
jgi:hypothetical protein